MYRELCAQFTSRYKFVPQKLHKFNRSDKSLCQFECFLWSKTEQKMYRERLLQIKTTPTLLKQKLHEKFLPK